MLDHLKDKKIILASKSPRRQGLLKELGLDFEVRTKEIEELYPPALQREEIPRYLSRLKAAAFKEELRDEEILITSDTVVWAEGESLEKAADRRQAIEMLEKLSGKSHEVITAVSITSKTKNITFHSTTKVEFAELAREEIEHYVDQYSPFDKAGAYGIQEWIGHIGVKSIEGSYLNVVGFPIQQIYEQLKKWT